jgi:outer membrane protein assembly factor BamC
MTIKQIVGFLLCSVFLLSLGACKTISTDKKIDYKSTRTIPPLDVPPDLSSPPSDEAQADLQAVPGGTTTYSSYVAGRDDASAKPAGPTFLGKYDNIELVSAGNQRWLMVEAEPEKLWPSVREFFLSNGLLISRENPETGTIETEWAENRANVGTKLQRVLFKTIGSLYSTGTRDKFRVRLERGAKPGTSEIFLSLRGMREIVTDPGGASPVETLWEPSPPDPLLESEMLRLLMTHLGVSTERAKKLLAEGRAPERASLNSSADGRLALNLRDSMSRAWRRVGLSLDRIGLTVEDRDRSKGVYYVRDAGEEAGHKKRGFFSRLFRRKKEDPVDPEYQVSLKSTETGTDVVILDQVGAPLNAKQEKRILSLLYEQLK